MLLRWPYAPQPFIQNIPSSKHKLVITFWLLITADLALQQLGSSWQFYSDCQRRAVERACHQRCWGLVAAWLRDTQMTFFTVLKRKWPHQMTSQLLFKSSKSLRMATLSPFTFYPPPPQHLPRSEQAAGILTEARVSSLPTLLSPLCCQITNCTAL